MTTLSAPIDRTNPGYDIRSFTRTFNSHTLISPASNIVISSYLKKPVAGFVEPYLITPLKGKPFRLLSNVTLQLLPFNGCMHIPMPHVVVRKTMSPPRVSYTPPNADSQEALFSLVDNSPLRYPLALRYKCPSLREAYKPINELAAFVQSLKTMQITTKADYPYATIQPTLPPLITHAPNALTIIKTYIHNTDMETVYKYLIPHFPNYAKMWAFLDKPSTRKACLLSHPQTSFYWEEQAMN